MNGSPELQTFPVFHRTTNEDQTVSNPAELRRKFHDLLDPIDLSIPSSSKYEELERWLEGLMQIRLRGISVKAVSAGKQLGNRLGELESKGIEFGLFVTKDDRLVDKIATSAAKRVGTGGHARAFGVAAKGSDDTWTLRTIVEPDGGPFLDRWRQIFPGIEHHQPMPNTDNQDPEESRSSPREARVDVATQGLDLTSVHDDFTAALRESQLSFGIDHDEFVRTFLASLATKRFVILTGLSGSGKTQIAMRFGEWLGEGTWQVVPVRPDWTGAEALFGYEDALLPVVDGARAWHVPDALRFMLGAARDPRRPYVLILDEMNLAHVERYFADFLSGAETGQPCLPNLQESEKDGAWRLAPVGPRKIAIPRNLFVIGTVNIDETTYLFSPKVLDRANTIEFRVRTADLQPLYRKPTRCRSGAQNLVETFLSVATDDDWQVNHPAPTVDAFSSGMKRVHEILSGGGFEFGHRVFYEALRFAAMFAAAGDPDPYRALDRQLMQKVLPRLHGSRRRLEPTLCALGAECFQAPIDAEARRRFDPMAPPSDEPKLPISFEKIRRMVRGLRANQFTSFTE